KYDFSGDKKWSVDMKTTGDDVVHGLFDDGVGVLVAGRTNGFFEADGEGKNNGGYDVFLARYNYSGDELWTDHLGTAKDDIATDVYVDDDNNVFVTGYTFGDLFETQTTANTADMFLVRYFGIGYRDSSNEIHMTTDSNTYSLAVAVDDNGSKYIAGYSDGTIGYSTSLSGSSDGFLVKYSSLNNKTPQWALMFGSSENDAAVDVAVDSGADAVYITGYTYGAFSLDGSGDANVGGSDAYLIKLNESGTQVWKKSIATSADDFGEGIALDKDGNICVAGSTSGNLDGNTNAGGSDVFLVKYDSGGNWLWSRLIGTGSRDSSADVTIDVSGNIYVTGTTYGALDGHTNLGSGDMFLVRFNASGEKQ
ncbi:MAG: hypothetical protein GY866_15760, partial [Proteobacteria bacterium]|nr:hypothetical protein [Pseudomonadota bacterium]